MWLGPLRKPRNLWLSMILALAPAWSARAQEGVLQPGESARQRANEAPPPAAVPPVVAPSAPPVAPPEAGTPAATQVPVAAEPTAPAETAEPSSSWVESTPIVTAPPASPPSAADDDGNRSYEARAVVDPVPGTLREEERIGEYAQPRWTAQRRFPNTRIYVRPAGTVGFEWWLEQKLDLEDLDQVRYRSQYEFEFGLGHRLQSDIYLQTEQNGHHGAWQLAAEKLELRWALADWGALPLNPTLYLEFTRQHDAPPKVEVKALVGEELAARVHFGLNLVFEHELGGALENEYAITTGVSYSIADEQFSLGAEVKFETVDVSGQRLTFDNWELLGGPSLSWSPVPPMHVLFVALFGNETEGPQDTSLFEPTLILGWEF